MGVREVLRRFGTAEPDLSRVPDGWPADRVQEMRLEDGTHVRLRPVLPDDGVELQEALKRLSPRTRWLRFHAPVDRFTDDQLRYLVEVDHHDREALVAEVRDGWRAWQPVAVARWHRDLNRPDEAELAIVIEDEYQGRGLGLVLLTALAEIARDEENICVLTGEVIAENRGMLGLLERVGVATERRGDGSVVHTRTWLVEPDDREDLEGTLP